MGASFGGVVEKLYRPPSRRRHIEMAGSALLTWSQDGQIVTYVHVMESVEARARLE